jgi:hypothetical protein
VAHPFDQLPDATQTIPFGSPRPVTAPRDGAFAQWVATTDRSLLELEAWLLSDRDPSGPYPLRPSPSGWRRGLRRCG